MTVQNPNTPHPRPKRKPNPPPLIHTGHTPRFLYLILKQLNLKSINWTLVAEGTGLSSGRAAQGRFAKFRRGVESGILGDEIQVKREKFDEQEERERGKDEEGREEGRAGGKGGGKVKAREKRVKRNCGRGEESDSDTDMDVDTDDDMTCRIKSEAATVDAQTYQTNSSIFLDDDDDDNDNGLSGNLAQIRTPWIKAELLEEYTSSSLLDVNMNQNQNQNQSVIRPIKTEETTPSCHALPSTASPTATHPYISQPTTWPSTQPCQSDGGTIYRTGNGRTFSYGHGYTVNPTHLNPWFPFTASSSSPSVTPAYPATSLQPRPHHVTAGVYGGVGKGSAQEPLSID